MRRFAPSGAAGFALLATLLVAGSCARAGRQATLPPLPPTSPTESATPVPPLEPSAPVPPAPVAPAAPTPPTPPIPPSVAPPVAAPAPSFTGWVRIGLASDLESVTLPCCDGELSVDVGGSRLDVASPLRIRPATSSLGGAVYRVQIAALKDENQALELARRLGALASLPADARFDAQAGIYRVRVGRFVERGAAEEAARGLVRYGVDNSWIVSEGTRLGAAALEVIHRGVSHRVAGRSFVLAAPAAPADSGVRWEGRRYRGRLEVYLNDRGRLNVVNELPIEQYLRGVVPRELGPGAYPEIEALKAQAIAARSYTLRNLGEFSDEGYDLCGTPRCQVYGGMDDEHPLSDRAIAETAGEVLLYGGQPIDALYSATCGGHTENVEVIFPLKRAPYLRGVPCIEAGEATLRNRAAAGSPPKVSRTVLDRALPGIAGRLESAADLEQAFRRLAGAAGLETPEDHLASLERREVQRYLGSMFDLAADARLFVRPEELAYLVTNPPPEWNVDDRRLAAYLVKSGLLAAPQGLDDAASRRLAPGETEELLFQLALFLRVVEQREASFSSLGAGSPADLVARDDGAELHFVLPPDLATFRIEGGVSRPGDLLLEAGDGLKLYLAAGELLAVAQVIDPRGTSYDRTHNLSRWTRFRSDADLSLSVAARLPGFAFRSFEVLRRGVSGRVGKIRLLGRDGETIDVEGLAVRWTLDLPDTLFTARRLAPAKGEAGWQFSGRGWGHGVGLCQVGSYGMARRGHDARAILTHYYGGATLQRLAYASGAGSGGSSGSGSSAGDAGANHPAGAAIAAPQPAR